MLSRTAQAPVPVLTTAIRLGVALVGTIGFALSYDALRQMAVAIHIRGILTYAFPLVIDGFIAIGVAALLILRTAPWRSRLYVWALVGIATITSIWANALHAIRLNQQAHTAGFRLDDVTVGALSAIAPLALAGAVHLDLVIRRHPTRHVEEAEATKRHSAPGHGHNHSDCSAPTPTSSGNAGLTEQAEMLDAASPPRDVARDAMGVPQVRRPLATAEGHERDDSLDELLALARSAPLGRGGRASRRNIEAVIRDAGFPIGKDRLTQIKDQVQAALQRQTEPDKEPADAL
ncbi:DUF2637 domain-containing protein [Streptomyces sp. NPDC008137]|uniref:DUF2637 domain-containing protein n=1 Tax=Streptomyces sp. NPDC008137 TaxID=3364813 RepID=UPI0036E2E6DF